MEHGAVHVLHMSYWTEHWPGKNVVVNQGQGQLFVLVQAVEVHLVPEKQVVLRQTGFSQQKGAVRAQGKLSPWDVEQRHRYPLTIKTLQQVSNNDEQNNNPQPPVQNYHIYFLRQFSSFPKTPQQIWFIRLGVAYLWKKVGEGQGWYHGVHITSLISHYDMQPWAVLTTSLRMKENNVTGCWTNIGQEFITYNCKPSSS